MKWIIRVVGGLLVLLVVLAAALWFWRMPLAERFVAGALADAGIEGAEVEISRLSLGGATLSVDAPDLSGQAAATYEIGELWKERRVRTITLSGLRGEVDLTADPIRIAGIELPAGDGEKSGGEAPEIPFGRLMISDVRLTLITADGPALVSAEGMYTPEEGGEARVSMTTDRAGMAGFAVGRAQMDAEVTFVPMGEATGRAAFAGDIMAAQGAVRGAELSLEGRVADWAPLLSGDMPKQAEARLRLSSASVGAADTNALRAMAEGFTPLGEDLGAVSISGELHAVLDDGSLLLDLADGPLEVLGAKGAFIRLRTKDGEPLLLSSPEGKSGAVFVEAETPFLAGNLAVTAAGSGAGLWQLSAEGDFSRAALGGTEMALDHIRSAGTFDGQMLRLQTEAEGRVAVAKLGAFTVSNAPLSLTAPLEVDLVGGRIAIPPSEDAGVTVSGARVRSATGTMTGQLRTLRLTAGDSPLMELRLDGGGTINGAGKLSLARMDARLGETDVSASSLSGTAKVAFNNVTQTTDLTVDLGGGRALIEDVLALGDMRAGGTIRVVPGDASGTISVRQLTVSEPREAPRFAAFNVTGPVRLSGRGATFDLAVATPKGRALGAVTGRHAFETGRGQARFDSGTLTFARGGLQPAALVPPLLGIIADATGVVEAQAEVAWGQGDLQTSAVVRPQGLSFQGPGVVVERTTNVSGQLAFADLMPVRTDGVQTLTIDSVDFGSLALPDGTLDFALPGDDSLLIEAVEFPLFGGRLWAEDAIIGFDGGSDVTLRADNIELQQLLDFIDVEGLTGEGRVDGELPLKIDPFAIEIVDGRLLATSPGIVRFVGPTADAAAGNNPGARLAFDVLEDLRFDTLGATINGRLDGDLDFQLTFNGESEVDLDGDGAAQDIEAPVIFRARVQVPLIALIDQARLSRDTVLQIQRARELEADQE